MKSKFYIIIALTLLVIIARGCFKASGWSLSASKNEIVILQESLPDNLDPAKNYAYEQALPLTGIYEGLIKFNSETLAPEPCLAESWDVSEDGTHWNFSLFPGLRFSDGAPCNAEAVRASMIRAMSLKDADPYPAFVFAPVEAIETTGEYTLTFTLKYPLTPFLKNLALPFAAPVVSPAALSKYGDQFWKYPSGTGPYILDSLGKNKIVLSANPYFRGQLPQDRKIVFKAVSDPVSRADQLLAGKADLVMYPAANSLDALRSGGMKITSLPGLDLSFLGFYTDKSPFADNELRRAVAGILDRGKIVSRVMGEDGVPADGILPPALAGAKRPKITPYTPEQVRKLLSKKGYPGGIDVTLITYQDSRRYCPPGGELLAGEIKRQLEPAGIRVKLVARPWNEHKEAMLRKEGDFYLYGWTCDNGDSDNFLHTLFHSTQVNSGLNASRFVNQKLDVYLVTARRIADGQARKKLYDECENIIRQEVPVIPINHSIQRIAVAPGLKGATLSGFGLINLSTLTKG